MLRSWRDGELGEGGFSLIEMLVIVLIIAALAAIAIPIFFDQRNRSYEAQSRASLRDAATAMKSFATNNDGTFLNPGDEANLVGEGFRSTNGVDITIETGGSDFCLQADHDSLPDMWRYEAGSGLPLAGPCP
jgi:type II secretory pathway pseudopilin PulG